MYVTRPLSQFRKSPSTLAEEPPEGPFSGVLVITDEEAEAEDMHCFGICKRTRVKKLPFPQDKVLSVVHTDRSGYRESSITKVLFIPVLDQPLSSNRYYVIRAKGKYKGYACVCSRETDEVCCFPGILQDKSPKPLNPRNIYQTIKIKRHHGHTFFAKSIAPDGIPPSFLVKKGWEIKDSKRLFPLKLKDALGLDEDLRTRLPDFNFPVSTKRSSTVLIGEWYCPFMFIKEPYRVRYQMKKSIFYKMTLTQHWEQIYYCENTNVNRVNGGNNNGNNTDTVKIDVNMGEEVNYVLGMEARRDEKAGEGGFYWYRVIPSSRDQPSGNLRKKANSRLGLGLGLSFAVVKKMRRVAEEGGWLGGGERLVKIEEEIRVPDNIISNNNNNSSNSNNNNNGGRSNSSWRKFGCYMLVESFRLRRMDGTLLLKCVFRHTHRVRCKWE